MKLPVHLWGIGLTRQEQRSLEDATNPFGPKLGGVFAFPINNFDTSCNYLGTVKPDKKEKTT
jgi:hypothetical protein